MINKKICSMVLFAATCFIYISCNIPKTVQKQENTSTPAAFTNPVLDTTNSGLVKWRDFFTDPDLTILIDTAIKNNQELNIALQDIEIAKNEVKSRKGDIAPNVNYGAGIGVDKAGRYTSEGAGDASTDITPGRKVPDILGDYNFGLNAEWEVDVWHKLHNAKDAEVQRYLGTIEGKNFVLTNLIAEVANSFYELRALDYQLVIINETLQLQKNALEIIKIQKQAAAANELAVQKFEAEVKGTESKQYAIKQEITEAENRINFLLARYPQPIPRGNMNFLSESLAKVNEGIPSQLLINRPDVKEAEYQLAASKLDVTVAKAEFYPSFNISGKLGFQAFDPAYLIRFPESIVGSLVGDLAGPLINKRGIEARYSSADARQKQAIYNYERSILNAYIEVANQLSNINNLQNTFDQQTKQVDALNKSVEVSNYLYKAARADYFEVLMTQRDALEAKLDLADTKKEQFVAVINTYKALGGGWR